MFHHLPNCTPMSSSAMAEATTTTGERKVDLHPFDSRIQMFQVVQPQQLQHQQQQPKQKRASNDSRHHHRRQLIARLQHQQQRASARSALHHQQEHQPHQQHQREINSSGSSSPSPSDEGSKNTQNSAATNNSANCSSTGSRTVKTQRTGTVTTSSTPDAFLYHRPPMIDVGMDHYHHGRYDEALVCFRSVLKNEARKGFGGCEDDDNAVVADYRPFVAQTMTSIGSIYLKQGRLDQASQSLLEALQLIQQLRDGVGFVKNADTDDLGAGDEGDDVGMNKNNNTIPMSTVGILNNLGTIALLRHDHDTSLKYYRASLIDARRHLHAHQNEAVDDDHAKDVAKTLHNIGRVLIFQQEWNAALSVLTEALHVEEELCLNSSENVIAMEDDTKAMKRHTVHHVDTLNLIGFVLLELEGVDQALFVFADVLTIVRRHYGLFHEQVANSLVHVAMVVERQGRLPAARKTYKTALDVFCDLGYDEQGGHPTVLALIDAIQQIDEELYSDKKVPNSVVVLQEGSFEFTTKLCDSMDDSREFDGARCRADHEYNYRDSECDEGIAERQEEYDSFDSRDDEY